MSSYGSKPVVGDLSTQWQWHEEFRDIAKNMYRTSYSDMVHGREVSVKSDFPAGYGGHIRSLRFDVLCRNSSFDRTQAMNRANPSRDSFVSFQDQLEGIPTYCMKPCGAKKVPSAGAILKGNACSTPWAQTLPLNHAPSYRSAPTSTLRASRSMSALGRNVVSSPAHSQRGLEQSFLDAANARAQQSTPSERDMLRQSVNDAARH
jgi:hypothetical protein